VTAARTPSNCETRTRDSRESGKERGAQKTQQQQGFASIFPEARNPKTHSAISNLSWGKKGQNPFSNFSFFLWQEMPKPILQFLIFRELRNP
jgi:hypothetical protein